MFCIVDLFGLKRILKQFKTEWWTVSCVSVAFVSPPDNLVHTPWRTGCVRIRLWVNALLKHSLTVLLCVVFNLQNVSAPSAASLEIVMNSSTCWTPRQSTPTSRWAGCRLLQSQIDTLALSWAPARQEVCFYDSPVSLDENKVLTASVRRVTVMVCLFAATRCDSCCRWNPGCEFPRNSEPGWSYGTEH